jgi:hypothetical protein
MNWLLDLSPQTDLIGIALSCSLAWILAAVAVHLMGVEK